MLYSKRPNNDRNTKFGRGGRGPVRDGKREYDRRSGTGRGKETKKDGGGAHNWGSDKNEARQAEGGVKEDGQDATTEEVAKEERKERKEEYVPEPEPEPVEDKTISYEEYLATKKGAENPLLAPTKMREVSSEFAGLKPKVVEEEDFLVMGGAKQKRKKEKKEEEKPKIELAFRVESAASSDDRGLGEGHGRGRREGRGEGRGRGGRGGRGGGRDGGRGDRGPRGSGRGDGRGSRGAGRGGRGPRGSSGINPLDESAFPSL
jgi:plasminogen activator inhibitor 1 RNA-binding protein